MAKDTGHGSRIGEARQRSQSWTKPRSRWEVS